MNWDMGHVTWREIISTGTREIFTQYHNLPQLSNPPQLTVSVLLVTPTLGIGICYPVSGCRFPVIWFPVRRFQALSALRPAVSSAAFFRPAVFSPTISSPLVFFLPVPTPPVFRRQFPVRQFLCGTFQYGSFQLGNN